MTAGARMVVDSGSLPRSTLGAAGVVGLARGSLAVEVQGAAYGRQFTVSGPHDGVGGAYVDLATLGARGCGRRRLGIAELRACLGGELGREATRGVNIARPATSSSMWAAVSTLVRLRAWPDAPVSPTVGFGAGLPILSASVSIDGYRNVFEPSKAFAQGVLGLDVRLF